MTIYVSMPCINFDKVFIINQITLLISGYCPNPSRVIRMAKKLQKILWIIAW